MKEPKISIITVTFNAINHIEKTICSLLNQTYQNIEFIIIDGGSNDGTRELIKKYETNISYWISEPDKGIFDAMNKGLIKATGDWINFMNAGDTFYENNTLQKIFENDKFSDIGVIYGSTFSNGNIRHPGEVPSLRFGGIMACHQSIFYNRNICGNQLFYKTKHKHYGDIELTRRLYLKNIKFKKVNQVIANYLGGGFSSSISWKARIAKFDYLFQNMGILGLWYGALGKIFYLRSKYSQSK